MNVKFVFWLMKENSSASYYNTIELIFSKHIVVGWELVRRVKPGNSWHPATDNLRGCDVYGMYINNGSVNSTFSIPYDITQVQDFLFITGDRQKWLIASAYAVMNNGNWYEDEPRNITKSSNCSTPYQAKWYRREIVEGQFREDPWISLTDHNESIYEGNILYGEDRYHYGSHASNILPQHNGANVYIRIKGFLSFTKYMIRNNTRNFYVIFLLV